MRCYQNVYLLNTNSSFESTKYCMKVNASLVVKSFLRIMLNQQWQIFKVVSKLERKVSNYPSVSKVPLVLAVRIIYPGTKKRCSFEYDMTHPLTQCAAVRTTSARMRAPPQRKASPTVSAGGGWSTRTAAIQGYSPMSVSPFKLLTTRDAKCPLFREPHRLAPFGAGRCGGSGCSASRDGSCPRGILQHRSWVLPQPAPFLYNSQQLLPGRYSF